MTQESVTFLKNFLVKLRRKSMIILLFFPILHRGGFYQVSIRLINWLIPPLCFEGFSALEIWVILSPNKIKTSFFFILFVKQNVKFTCLENKFRENLICKYLYGILNRKAFS